MTQKNLNRVAMWKTVYAVLQQYRDTWKDNEAFAEAADNLKSAIDAADKAGTKQMSGGTTGITGDTNALADAAIAATVKVTKIARAYATKTGDLTLYAAVNVNKGALENTPHGELEAQLQSMLNAALGVKDKLGGFGFKDGMDTAATGAIAAFSNARPNTRVTIAGRSGVTGSVPDIMKDGKKELLIIDDLVHLFDEDVPEFVATYKAARNVVHAGTRHEGKPAA